MNTQAIKILLVDDHAIVREGLRSLIGKMPGLSVMGEASRGHAALELVRAQQPDLVIMDIHLPDENGLATSRKILAEFPSVKIIVLSADSSMPIVVEALEAGIRGYLMKEKAPQDLQRAIEAVLDQQTYLCPELASLVVKDYLKHVAATTIPSSKPDLTDRELEILKLVAAGKRSKEIAETLQLSVKTVENHRARLLKKLHCSSTGELIRFACREGIVTD